MEAEEVVDKAARFLEKKAGQNVHRLVAVELAEDIWKVTFDTGIVEKEFLKLEIDDASGRVIRYGRPE